MRQKIRSWFNRKLTPIRWGNLRSVTPVSNVFGFDRGTPIDRIYIEDFLKKNKQDIKGHVLEIGDSTYSKKYGSGVNKYDVLHFSVGNPNATIVGDLARPETLPEGLVDCFICTQTLNFIYDSQGAVEGISRLLKTGGVALVTVAGICQISRYDMEQWGDYWRFTTRSLEALFKGRGGAESIAVGSYGNVLTSMCLLHGISAEEISEEQLFFHDDDYQVLITLRLVKA